MASFALERYV